MAVATHQARRGSFGVWSGSCPRGNRYEAAIADETVDPLTRSLLRWFSDVEADSGARLHAIYDRIEAQAG
jgi:hypothetical protein